MVGISNDAKRHNVRPCIEYCLRSILSIEDKCFRQKQTKHIWTLSPNTRKTEKPTNKSSILVQNVTVQNPIITQISCAHHCLSLIHQAFLYASIFENWILIFRQTSRILMKRMAEFSKVLANKSLLILNFILDPSKFYTVKHWCWLETPKPDKIAKCHDFVHGPKSAPSRLQHK